MSLRRYFGVLLMIAAVAGLVLSIIGLVAIWRFRPALTQTVLEGLSTAEQTLAATQDGLTAVSQLVETARGDVGALQKTIDALASTIHQINPLLDSVAGLADQDVPAMVDATQTALESARSSALFIDNFMQALASIPLLETGIYKPEKPLNTAIGEVITSLDAVAPSLSTISGSLKEGKKNLGTAEEELRKISDATGSLGDSLGDARDVLERYQQTTTGLKQQVQSAQAGAAGWITGAAWVGSLALGWLMLAQLGLGAQGYDMLRSRRR